MKMVLVTPLYPPDIAEPAPYSKELARRLSLSHTVTILTYGTLPEAAPHVEIKTVSKQLPLFIRMVFFTYLLLVILKKKDVLIVENGPSVELPAAIVLLFKNNFTLFHTGDERAVERVSHSQVLRTIERFLRRKSTLLSTSPLPRPEILPFGPYPTDDMNAYEHSWIAQIESIEQYV